MAARSIVASVLLAAAILLRGAFAQEKAQPAGLESSAKAFVEMLDKGEFAKATEGYDAAMRKALPAAELKKTWDKLIGEAGAYKKTLRTRQETKGKYEAVIVT